MMDGHFSCTSTMRSTCRRQHIYSNRNDWSQLCNLVYLNTCNDIGIYDLLYLIFIHILDFVYFYWSIIHRTSLHPWHFVSRTMTLRTHHHSLLHHFFKMLFAKITTLLSVLMDFPFLSSLHAQNVILCLPSFIQCVVFKHHPYCSMHHNSIHFSKDGEYSIVCMVCT